MPIDPADHVGLAVHIARRFRTDDPEALVGEALLALVRAAPNFDASRGSEAGYLGTCIEHAVIAQIRRERRRPPTVPLFLENGDGEEWIRDDLGTVDPGPEAAAARRDVERILAALPARDALLLRLRFGLDDEAVTLEKVGAELGVSGTRAAQLEAVALRRARRLAGAGKRTPILGAGCFAGPRGKGRP